MITANLLWIFFKQSYMINCGIITKYSNFQNIFIQVLNNQAPTKKKKFVLTSLFMTKSLKKAIMKRSRLKNKYIWKKKIRKVIRSKGIFVFTFYIKLKQNALKI